MEVYGCDPFISIDAAWRLDSSIIHVKNREDIFSECDIITVHVPLLDDTRGMINEKTIAMMKDGVILLNFARDALVDEDDQRRGNCQDERRRDHSELCKRSSG